MAEITWKNGVSGTWGTGSNWTGGVAPNSSTADATIAVAGAYTVTLASSTSDTVDSVTFNNSAANFDLLGTLTLGGSLATFMFDGSDFLLGSAGSINGGTLDIDTGTLVAKGGKISTADFILGPFASLDLGGGTLTLGGTADLNGYIAGNNTAGSALVITGSALLGNAADEAELESKATLIDAGSITQSNILYLGGTSNDVSSIVIDAGATYNDASGGGFILQAGTATVTNAGLFEATGAGTSNYDAVFHETGTMLAAGGSRMELEGGGTIGGTLTGAGEIDFVNGTFTLAPSVVINVATVGLFSGATLALNGHSTTLSDVVNLAGAVAGNGSAGNTLAVTGYDTISGTAYVENDATLVDAGTITEGNLILYLGDGNAADTSSLIINAGAVYDLAQNAAYEEIDEQGGSGAIFNAGLFEDSSTFNVIGLTTRFINTGTVLAIAESDLQFAQGGTIGGTLTGAGEIDFNGGNFSLSPSIAISAGTLGFDGGTVTLGGNLNLSATDAVDTGGVIDLNGYNITLGSAAFSGNGEIAGPGTVYVTGSATNSGLDVVNGAVLDISGTVDQAASNNGLYLSTNAAGTEGDVKIEAGGTLDLAGGNYGSNMQDYGDGASLINYGLIDSTYDGAGSSANLEVVTLINFGTIESDTGAVQFYEGGTVGGALTGAGEFDFDGGTFTLLPSIAISVGTLGMDAGVVTLGGNVNLADTFVLGGSGSIALNGHDITLAGSSLLDGYIYGPGTMLVTGQGVVSNNLEVYSGATLEDAGTITQTSGLSLADGGAGDTATLNIDAGAVYNIENQGGTEYGISAPGTAVINNAGLLELTGYWNANALAAGQIAAIIKNTGTVSDIGSSGVVLTNTLVNDGLITISGTSGLPAAPGLNGYINAEGPVIADAGKTGTIVIGAGGYFGAEAVAASQTVRFTGSGASGGVLTLGSLGGFQGTVTGFSAGDAIDLAGVLANGFTYANNILTLTEAQNGGAAEVIGSITLAGVTGTLSLVGDGFGGTEIVLNNPGTNYSNPTGATSTKTWNGSNAAWTTGADWTPAGEPGASNIAYINSGTVSYATTDTVNQLYLNASAAKLSMTSGKLTVDAGGLSYGTVAISGGVFDAATGYDFEGTENLSGGTLEVDSAFLRFGAGNAVLGSAITGAGWVNFAGGNVTLNSGFALDAAYALVTGAAVTLGTGQTISAPMVFYSGSLDLNSHYLTLAGSSLLGDFDAYGPGNLDITGAAQIGNDFSVYGTVNVIDAGSMTQNGALYIGDSSTDKTSITITSTGIYDIADNGVNQSIYEDGIGSMTNAGLLEMTGYGGDTQTIELPVISTGTILVTEGTLALNGAGTLSGTLEGAGAIDLAGGNYLLTSLTANIATLDVTSSNITLGSNLTVTGAFTDTGGGVIDLNGHNLILDDDLSPFTSVAGPGTLYALNTISNATLDSAFAVGAGATVFETFAASTQFGAAGGSYGILDGLGTLVSAGTVSVTDTGGNFALFISGGINWDVTGTVLDAGKIGLGFYTAPDSGTISVASTGVFDLTGDDAVVQIYQAGTYALNNAGLLEKTGGNYGFIESYVTNTGTILSNSGTLEIEGSALGGVIGGGSGIVALTGNLFNGAAGTPITTFASGAQFGVAGGNYAILDGLGTLVSAGTVSVADSGGNYAMFLTNGVEWDVTGTVLDAGKIGLGYYTSPDSATISVASTGVFDLTGDDAVVQIYQAGTYALNNAGLLEKTGGNYSFIEGYVTNTGTILSNSGTLEIESSALGGVIGGGTGIVALTGNLFNGVAGTPITTFASGAQFGVAGGNYAILDGPGTLVSAGTVSVADSGGNYDMFLTNGVEWDVTGTVLDAGRIGLGFYTSPDAGTISVASTGVFDLTGDDAVVKIYQGGSYAFNNAGLLEKTGGNYSFIQAYVTNTGTILSNSGTLEIEGSALGGAIGGGTAIVGLTGNLFNGASSSAVGITTFASGAQFGVAGGNYAILDGLGTLVSAGTVSVADSGGNYDMFLTNGVEWDVTGTVLDAGKIGLGFYTSPDSATISVASTGVFDLTGDDALMQIYQGGTYALNNAGLLEKTGGTAVSQIQAYVTNTGSVIAASGVLDLDGGISNDASGTLTGGSWAASAIGTMIGTLELVQDPAITTDAANIVLAGAGAEIYTGNSAVQTIEASLTSIAAGGTLQNLGGHTYASSNTITDAGLIVLGGGKFAPASVTVASAGVVSGFGTLAAPVHNTGTVIATGGTLALNGSVTGIGSLELTPHADLVLGAGVTAGQIISFSGTQETLTLEHPGTMLGTLSGFGPGDVIDIANTMVSAVSVSGNIILITLSGGAVVTETLAAPLPPTERFGISSDGGTGSDLTLFRKAVGNIIAPMPLALGNHHVGDSVSTYLTIANSVPADGYSEALDASFSSYAGNITATGAFTGLAAGATNSTSLDITPITSTAGSIAGNATVAFSTDGTGTDGDPTVALGSQTVAVTGGVYAYASASLGTTTIALGNVHAGAVDTKLLTLTDSATNIAYTEALDATFSSTTGSAIDSGSVYLLGAGATNSTSLSVGLMTGTAGALSGTAILGLTSDGTGIDGLGTTALPSQTIDITGSVFNYATASLGSTLSLGEHHTGTTASTALTLKNIALTGTYSEGLDASFSSTSITAGSFSTSGAVTTLAAGSSNNSSLVVKLGTGTAGTVAGVAVVTLNSDGAGIDGLGTTSLGTETIAVSGAVFNYATAALTSTTISLGEHHAGLVNSAAVTIKNSAAAGAYSEKLDAKFSGTSFTQGSFTTGGTISTLTAGSSSSALGVTLAGVGGVISGHATIALTSDGSGIDTLSSTALTSKTVAVTGTLFNYATASLTTTTLSLGEHHVGDVVTGDITLSNSAAAGLYSENLDASFSGTSFTHGTFADSGSISLLAAGATNATSLAVTLGTGTAGTVAGAATIALKSDGSGIDTLGTTALTAKTVAVTGAVYNYATAALPSTVISLGVVHTGGSLSEALTLSNSAAPGAYSEALDAAFAGGTGSAMGSGTVTLLQAGATNSSSLVVGLSIGQTGVLSGSEVLALISDGSGIDTLGTTTLASETITITGTVDNYATAALEQIGGAGTLSGSGTTYTLALGNIQQGTGSLTANVGVLNSAAAISDLLGGNFTISNPSGAFTNTSFSSFSGLAAGQADTLPTITLSGTNAGNFSELITLSSAGSNASGYNGTLANITLDVTGNVLHTYTLTTGVDTIAGVGPDLIIAQTGQLSAGDIINAGTGINVLTLVGGGIFDMRAPATLTGISIVDAQEGIGSLAQTLYLDAGFAGTVNAASGTAGSSIVVYGNLDSATVNLGSGNDTVYVGSPNESIYGGGGNDLFYVNSGDVGATINGGSGNNTLEVAGGGSYLMTSNVTSISSVFINELSSQSTTFTANTIANLAITGGAGNDTIILGAASQSVSTGTGNTVIEATAAQAGAAIVNNGNATLDITTGGTVSLNASDEFLTVSLSSATNLTLSQMSFITAIGSSGNDTITALAAQQTLTGGAGIDTLIGYAGFGDTFQDTTSGLNGDTIQYFGGNDLIDITNLARAGASISYSGTSAAGTLSVSESGLGVVSTITLTSGTNLSAALFHLSSDGHGGTYIG